MVDSLYFILIQTMAQMMFMIMSRNALAIMVPYSYHILKMLLIHLIMFISLELVIISQMIPRELIDQELENGQIWFNGLIPLTQRYQLKTKLL